MLSFRYYEITSIFIFKYYLKLHQFLFLNIISFVGYIDLFVYINILFIEQIYKLLKVIPSEKFILDLFAYNNIVIPIYLSLFLIEYLLVKSKKLQPIVKINNKVYIVQFYINLVISLSSAIFFFK